MDLALHLQGVFVAMEVVPDQPDSFYALPLKLDIIMKYRNTQTRASKASASILAMLLHSQSALFLKYKFHNHISTLHCRFNCDQARINLKTFPCLKKAFSLSLGILNKIDYHILPPICHEKDHQTRKVL